MPDTLYRILTSAGGAHCRPVPTRGGVAGDRPAASVAHARGQLEFMTAAEHARGRSSTNVLRTETLGFDMRRCRFPYRPH